jgi:hypothetical protein
MAISAVDLGLPGNGRQISVTHLRQRNEKPQTPKSSHPNTKIKFQNTCQHSNRVVNGSSSISLKRLGPDHPHHLSSVDSKLSN